MGAGKGAGMHLLQIWNPRNRLYTSFFPVLTFPDSCKTRTKLSDIESSFEG